MHSLSHWYKEVKVDSYISGIQINGNLFGVQENDRVKTGMIIFSPSNLFEKDSPIYSYCDRLFLRVVKCLESLYLTT